MLKRMNFYHLLEIYPKNIKKKLLDAGLYSLKTDFPMLVIAMLIF